MAQSERFRDAKKADPAKDFSVLLAVEPPAFHRLLEHVLFGHSGLRVVGASSGAAFSVRQAARLAPDVIIVSTRVNRKEHQGVLQELKRTSPASTLILLTHCLNESAPCVVADACLPEDAVVTQLLPVIRKAHRVRDRVRERVLTGSRT